MKKSLLASLFVCALLPQPAVADSNTDLAISVMKGTGNRARRAIALGPFVGASGIVDTSTDTTEFDVPISFGLELAIFKIPVLPGPEMVKEAIMARAKVMLKEQIEATIRAGGTPPSEGEQQEALLRLAVEVRDEIIEKLNVRPKTFEKPRFALVLEGAYLPRASDGQFRTTLAIGISKVTIGPTLLVHFGDDTDVSAGGELTLRALLKKAPRSPNLDMFLRADFAATDGAPQVFGLGARFMLDII